MSTDTPAAALDLDAIRADIERAGRACCIETCTNDVAEAQAVRTVAQEHAPALLAEVERLRKRVPPMFWCEGGEMSVVTDPAAFFSRPRPVEPFNIPVHVTDALPPGRVIAVSGPHGYNSDGSPIVSAVAADFDPPETTP